MKTRLKQTVKNTIAILCLGIFLYILYLHKISIPCPFKLTTHLNCPSCGVSRMCVSMLHRDMRQAFYYNQVLFFIFPALVLYYIFFQIRFIEHRILIGIIVLLILYGIIRNMPFWPYPLPQIKQPPCDIKRSRKFGFF